jgi:hypothetical protein
MLKKEEIDTLHRLCFKPYKTIGERFYETIGIFPVKIDFKI